MKKSILSVVLLMFLAMIAVGQINDTVYKSNELVVTKLTDFVYVYTSSTKLKDQGEMSANGIIIAVDRKAVLVDAPWDDNHAVALMDFIRFTLKATLQIAVITHAHIDRIGGIAELKRAYVPVYTLEATTMLAKEAGIPRPDIIFNDSLALNFSGETILLYFPGPGHSSDNIVVWVPSEYLLYGGCFIKDAEAQNLGNMKDADPEKWKTSLNNCMARFRDASIIIPGHGKPGGQELFRHTMDLLNKWKKP